MKETRCYRLREDLLLRRDRGDLALYDPVADQSYLLGPTAARIAELCDGRRTPGEIAAVLAAEYPRAAAQGHDLRADSDSVLADLRAAALLVEEPR